jgi:hypothetical protein
VLCPRESIFAEYIDDGVDGWLYADDRSALSLIRGLRTDRARVLEIGGAARAKAHRLFDPRTLTDAYVGVVSQWLRAS